MWGTISSCCWWVTDLDVQGPTPPDVAISNGPTVVDANRQHYAVPFSLLRIDKKVTHAIAPLQHSSTSHIIAR
jgi:hypothetical protein